jgi:hypothetical protein
MKPGTLVLAGVLATCASLPAGDEKTVVVVDPLDLRQPLADSEAALKEKYEGKIVQFTGLLVGHGPDAKQKKYWYTVQAAVPAGEVKGKAQKELISVRVSFHVDQKMLRTSKGRYEVAVAGSAVILTQGKYAMVIEDAQLVRARALPAKDTTGKR